MRFMSGAGGSSSRRRLLVGKPGRPLRLSGPRWVRDVALPGVEQINGPMRRRAIIVVAVLLFVVFGVAASSGFDIATAEDAMEPGRPVPANQVQPIAAAALSCPVLTPARLAGQLMAASGFNVNARTADGGVGVAGLTEASWNTWKPRPTANRADPAANIFALAHQVCDLAGQVRQARVGGDQWRLALGAYRSDVAAVRDAKGVPARAIEYVSRVAAYAAWYARQPEFAGTGPSPSPGPVGGAAPGTGTLAKPVPDDYVPAILTAGKFCPTVPPARIAAQLMAASAFNPNLLGADGAQGIAQFSPDNWARYAPNAATTSPWDPSTAIPVLGRAMCSLVAAVGELDKDPYQVALAAFQWGTQAVKQAGGVPEAPSLRNYALLVQNYAKTYSLDPRLGDGPGPTAGQAGPPRASPNPTVSSTGPAAGGPNTPPLPAPTVSAGPRPVGGPTLIIGRASNRCIDVPDGASSSNPQLQIWDCGSGIDQQWTFFSDGTLRAFDKCMTVAGGSPEDGTPIRLSTCSGSPSQRFVLNAVYDLVNLNPAAPKCVDAQDKNIANGTKLQLWTCYGTPNQKWHR